MYGMCVSLWGVFKIGILSRCSKLVYTIHVGISQFNIALPHSFAPTTVFHQSRSPLRSFFKPAVGTE